MAKQHTCIVAALLFIPIHIWETNNFYFHLQRTKNKYDKINMYCMQFLGCCRFTERWISVKCFIFEYLKCCIFIRFVRVGNSVQPKWEGHVKLSSWDMECKLRYCRLIYEYACSIENKSISLDKHNMNIGISFPQ